MGLCCKTCENSDKNYVKQSKTLHRLIRQNVDEANINCGAYNDNRNIGDQKSEVVSTRRIPAIKMFSLHNQQL